MQGEVLGTWTVSFGGWFGAGCIINGGDDRPPRSHGDPGEAGAAGPVGHLQACPARPGGRSRLHRCLATCTGAHRNHQLTPAQPSYWLAQYDQIGWSLLTCDWLIQVDL